MRPDDLRIATDIFVPAERAMGAVSGQRAVVELISYGESGRKPEGRIIEIIGTAGDPGTDILSLVRTYEIPTVFSEKILNQARRVAKPVSEADRAGRLDLRSWRKAGSRKAQSAKTARARR